MKKNLWVKEVQEEVKERQEKEKKARVAFIVSAVKDLMSYTPPEGLFLKGPDAIASQLKADAKDLKQAMSRLIFYINRAGDNLSKERRNALEKAKEKLRSLYDHKKEAVGVPPKAWWEEMVKTVKKKEPSYSEDIVKKTVGDIWHHKLSQELVRRYEK